MDCSMTKLHFPEEIRFTGKKISKKVAKRVHKKCCANVINVKRKLPINKIDVVYVNFMISNHKECQTIVTLIDY